MKPILKTSLAFVTFALLSACFGVPESRVKALEAQVQQLSSASPAAPAAPGASDEKTNALDAQVKTATAKIDKIDEVLEVLQREVSRLGAASSAGPAPAAAAGEKPSPMWDDLDAALGIMVDGVKVNGDLYTIDKKWLERELAKYAGSPSIKLNENKKGGGLSVKGIKAKTLPDALGLKNNDVVLAINDQAVDSVGDLYKALHGLTGPAKVKIDRKKKDILLQYQLAK